MSLRIAICIFITVMAVACSTNTTINNESADEAKSQAVYGAWVATRLNSLWTFSPDGYLAVSAREGGNIGALLSYKANARSIEVIDQFSPSDVDDSECASKNSGIYAYKIVADVMTLTRITDPCEPRRTRINGLELTRKPQLDIASNGAKNGQHEGNRVQNAHFKNGLQFWVPERGTQTFNWVDYDGHKGAGATVVQSMAPDNPKERFIYQVSLSQCVKLYEGRRYRFAASFKPLGEYKTKYANRVNLLWYQTEDCSSHGQFADYLEPEPNIQSWQRIIHEDRLRSLNAKAAKITIVQSRTSSNNQKALWDDIELTPTEMEGSSKTVWGSNQQHTLPIGQNYIENGDFKLNLTSWNRSGDTQWTGSEGANAPGAARLSILSDNGGRGANSFSQCVNIGANSVFQFGASVKIDPESSQKGGGIFRLSWYENVDCKGRSQAGFKEDRIEDIDGWQELSIDEIKAPPGAQSASIYITRGIRDSGSFAYFIDDVYFKAVGE